MLLLRKLLSVRLDRTLSGTRHLKRVVSQRNGEQPFQQLCLLNGQQGRKSLEN